MKYYIIKNYSKHITDENFILEIIDPTDNRWLINYGIQLDEFFDYINFTMYGEENLFFEQDIINPYFGIYLLSEKFQKVILQNLKTSVEIQLLSFKLFDTNSKEIKHNYKMINFLQTEECIDWTKSNFKVRDKEKKSYIFLNKVFDDYKISKLNKGIICVDCEKSILVSEDIKNQWDKLKLKSLAFSEIG
ncbi:MAG: hypothetical protein Q4B43_10370 [Bacteroidota bacterium]|uniref:hypothetical protein n=1 Tax=Capnocytophaga canimorsus TaxID=28188 RepID=UPI001ACC9E97|nr:hypothetical protein [Capnocytophaga canimorsus]MDO4729390.1 hypothetical protein [Bacteroidota bacterium]GIM57761.1 hypothetical protein CAPN006_21530 [Capnocytophaga canimorsus]